MNINIKTIQKKQAIWIQWHVKNLLSQIRIYAKKIGLVWPMKIKLIHQINRIKNKNNIVILNTEKSLDNI